METFFEISTHVSISQNVDQAWNVSFVSRILEKGDGSALVSDARCTTDSVNVLVNFIWHVIVDNGANVFDIETASGDTGSNQDTMSTVLGHM